MIVSHTFCPAMISCLYPPLKFFFRFTCFNIACFVIGEHIETSAQSESDRTSQVENTSDEDNTTTPKRTRMPRKPLFKSMCFLLTQAKEKENSEDQGMFFFSLWMSIP